METIVRSGRSAYPVVIAAGASNRLSAYAARRRVVVVHTQSVAGFVHAAIGPHLRGARSLATISIPGGEAGKTLAVAEELWKVYGESGLGRNDLVVAVGGGACSDAAGFAATTWRRGVDWVAVPTTVAGMVDAAIGGKVAVNSGAGKNTAAVFWDPLATLGDLSALDSLAREALASGLAEVIKVGLSHDPSLIDQLAIWDGRPAALHGTIAQAAAIAAAVASGNHGPGNNADVLALGHEIGHALESATGLCVSHGAGVAIGLRYAVGVAGAESTIQDAALCRVLTVAGLPSSPAELGCGVAWAEVRAELAHDRRMGGRLRFLTPTGQGCRWSRDLSEEAAAGIWARCGGS